MCICAFGAHAKFAYIVKCIVIDAVEGLSDGSMDMVWGFVVVFRNIARKRLTSVRRITSYRVVELIRNFIYQSLRRVFTSQDSQTAFRR